MKTRTSGLAGVIGVCLLFSQGARATTITSEINFITDVYEDLLNRTPDAPALALAPNLQAGTITHQQFAAFVLNSAEYRAKLVGSYFNDYLGRVPLPGELSAAVSFLGGGGLDQQVQAFLLGGAEFFADNLGTNLGFIGGLYSDLLNRPAGPGEKAGWLIALAGGATRTQVAAAVLGSVEYDTDLVTSYFLQFLHRSPNPPGLNGFVNFLQGGGTNETAIAAMMGSAEYFQQAQAPEPVSWTLTGVGLLVLVGRRGRGKAKHSSSRSSLTDTPLLR